MNYTLHLTHQHPNREPEVCCLYQGIDKKVATKFYETVRDAFNAAIEDDIYEWKEVSRVDTCVVWDTPDGVKRTLELEADEY